MDTIDKTDLKKRILELEAELLEREKDIAQYRRELSQANLRLESLIHQLQHEVKTAHAIQRSLVPTEFPNIPGFEFSTKFIPSMISGGDYFDIFNHHDRLRFGIVLASSSGHSMSALFLSILIKLTSQMEARRGSEPHNVIQEMAKEIIPHIEDHGQSELFYSLIDRRNYELHYCRHGGALAFHQNFSNGDLTLLTSSGASLTKNFIPPKKTEVLHLNSRDKIILCTKGVVETKNREGEPFGLARLCQSLVESRHKSVHETRNHLIFNAQKYSGYQELAQDLTVIVMEVKERVIKLART